jgi:hypothetical protein
MQQDEIKSGIKSGIISAIVPHLGCIAFIVFTLLGISAGSVFLKQFILASWSFPVLVFFSFVIAGISAFFYLKKNCCINKIKYVSMLFASVLVVNGLLFYVAFPWVANQSGKSTEKSNIALSELKIKVGIPCSGHATLITDELKKGGVSEVSYKSPDEFDVKYDTNKITKENILKLAILKEFKTTEI